MVPVVEATDPVVPEFGTTLPVVELVGAGIVAGAVTTGGVTTGLLTTGVDTAGLGATGRTASWVVVAGAPAICGK
jgi:hypothetical protein